MGKATGLMKELSGKIGPLQFQQTKSGKVAVFVAPEVPDTPLRTKKQMEIRLAWGNLGAVYSQFHKTLKRSHEGLAAGTSDYNAFIKENTRMTCVYLKKSELSNGGCVLAPYKISDGKLPSIYYDADDQGVLVSYMGDAAFEASVQSYGGITNRKVFLRPDDETNVAQGLWYGGGSGTGESTSGGNGGSSQGGNTGGGTNTGGNTGGGTNTDGNTGGGIGSVTPSTPKLTISRSGTGTSTVTVNGEGVSSGAEIAGGTEVTVSVTPAEGATPTASLNGNTVTLTESDGVYTGSFSMPSGNATLVINSGGTTGGGSGDMN